MMMQKLKSVFSETSGTVKSNDKDNRAWTGMLPVDDTALYLCDTGGDGIPVIYLNGQFANMNYWRRVISELGPGFRNITYDERARGRKSRRSSDYSFNTCVSDVSAVLASRGIKKCIVIGWSYGAFIAAHWASMDPDSCIEANSNFENK